MVQREHSHVLLFSHSQQHTPQQSPLLQHERPSRFFPHPPSHLLFPLFSPQMSHVHHRQFHLHFSRRLDHLPRLAFHHHESCPQHFVPPHHLLQASLQRPNLQPPLHPHRQRYVVEAVLRLQLIQKPHPLLRVRQRRLPTISFSSLQLRQSQPFPARQFFPYPFPQPTHRRPLKQQPNGKFPPVYLPNPRHHLRCQQRMPAQLKEVLLRPYLPHSQHLLPDPAQQLLYPFPPLAPSSLLPFTLNLRQRFAVDLPVAAQRPALHLHDPPRNHVLRQSFLQISAQAFFP
ncbi:hypothetical protein DYY66_0794 [Candidatus Nitrosotalea sp. FS]|nr:hypothetical protein [Candidatus Nitrosotalea sp. FS]